MASPAFKPAPAIIAELTAEKQIESGKSPDATLTESGLMPSKSTPRDGTPTDETQPMSDQRLSLDPRAGMNVISTTWEHDRWLGKSLRSC
jgi:hypothetical protein